MRARLREVAARCVALLRRRRDSRALDDEIDLHLQLLEERFRARGFSPDDARREARRAFGGVQQLREAHADERAFPWLAQAAQDAAYALRMLRRQPGFAAAAVLTLALGTGANTAVFSVLHAVILSPLPYPAPDRVERVGWLWNDRSPATGALAPFKFAYLREHARTFDALATWQFGTVESRGDGPLNVLRVSADFLDVVGARPAIGRVFAPAEHDADPAAALLTDRAWRMRFGADPAVLGRAVNSGDRVLTVIGVLPPAFEFPELLEPIDLIVPLVLRPDPTDLGANYPTMGRLRSGVRREEAEADLDRVFTQLRQERPDQFSGAGERGVLMSFQEIHLADVARPLWTLFAGVMLVLLIACTNVANLLLARGTTRLREMAVRGALGASRGRLLRQGIAEGLVIAAIGGAAGVAIGAASVRSLVGMAPGNVARLDQVGIDATVSGFAVVVVAITGAVFGLTATGIGALPRAGTGAFASRNTSATRAGRRVRQAMVGVESALAMLLVVGAVLLASGFYRLMQTPLGFEPDGLAAVTFSRLPAELDSPARTSAASLAVRDALAAVPGVTGVATTSVVPLGPRGFNMPMTLDGRPDASEGAVEWRTVSRSYADVVGLRLLSGRWFSDDDIARERQVAVVTEGFVSRYFPDGGAIGQRLLPGVFRGQRRPGQNAVPREIIGVVNDIRDLGPTRPVRRTVFLPEIGDNGMPAFLVRTSAPLAPDTLQAAVRRAGPALTEPVVSAMSARLGSRLARDRFSSLLMTTFAAVALFLTVVGVYGVVSWIVRHATHEIGIRVALGASQARVLRGVLTSGLQPVVAGLLAGGAAALMASGLFDGLVVGATSVSLRTCAAAAAVLLCAAALAAWVPARRALAVDPAAALRAD